MALGSNSVVFSLNNLSDAIMALGSNSVVFSLNNLSDAIMALGSNSVVSSLNNLSDAIIALDSNAVVCSLEVLNIDGSFIRIPIFASISDENFLITSEYILKLNDLPAIFPELENLKIPDPDTYFGLKMKRINDLIKENQFKSAQDLAQKYSIEYINYMKKNTLFLQQHKIKYK
jgi:hypothetical protein